MRRLRAVLGGPPAATIRGVALSAYALIRDAAAARSLASPAVEAAGGFDLVLVLGLLDYLRERPARRLLAALGPLVRPGGVLLLTNLHAENPWRAYMEDLLDWPAWHRSRADFERLVAQLDLETLELAPDPESGTNLFYAGRRA